TLQPHLQPKVVVVSVHPGLRMLQAVALDADLEPHWIAVSDIRLGTDVVCPGHSQPIRETLALAVHSWGVQMLLDLTLDSLQQYVPVALNGHVLGDRDGRDGKVRLCRPIGRFDSSQPELAQECPPLPLTMTAAHVQGRV